MSIYVILPTEKTSSPCHLTNSSEPHVSVQKKVCKIAGPILNSFLGIALLGSMFFSARLSVQECVDKISSNCSQSTLLVVICFSLGLYWALCLCVSCVKQAKKRVTNEENFLV